jgi:hypothetical protein
MVLTEKEALRKQLETDFPGLYVLIDEAVMARINRLKLSKEQKREVLDNVALLESNGLNIDDLLDELEQDSDGE